MYYAVWSLGSLNYFDLVKELLLICISTRMQESLSRTVLILEMRKSRKLYRFFIQALCFQRR